jgi:hypothetical protein
MQGQASNTSPTPASSTSMSRAALSPGHPERGREGGREGEEEGTAALQAVHLGHQAIRNSGKSLREVVWMNGACPPHPFFPLPCFFLLFLSYLTSAILLFLGWYDFASPCKHLGIAKWVGRHASHYHLKSLGDSHRIQGKCYPI